MDQARTVLEAAGLVVAEPEFIKNNDQPEGTVFSQDPAADTEVAEGSSVKLTIVTGKEVVTVPDVKNQPEAQAINTLTTAGFVIATDGRSEAFDPIVPVGAVISTDPRAGLEVASGTEVSYVVSKGPEPSPSPSPSPSPEPEPARRARRPSPTPEPDPEPEPDSPEPVAQPEPDAEPQPEPRTPS